MKFVWDPIKAANNRLLLADWEHGEPRIVAVGLSREHRVLFVVSADFDGNLVRIVSARKATKQERRRYEQGD